MVASDRGHGYPPCSSNRVVHLTLESPSRRLTRTPICPSAVPVHRSGTTIGEPDPRRAVSPVATMRARTEGATPKARAANVHGPTHPNVPLEAGRRPWKHTHGLGVCALQRSVRHPLVPLRSWRQQRGFSSEGSMANRSRDTRSRCRARYGGACARKVGLPSLGKVEPACVASRGQLSCHTS